VRAHRPGVVHRGRRPVYLAGTYCLRRNAWTSSLRAYFDANFVKVLADRQGGTLYMRRGLHPR